MIKIFQNLICKRRPGIAALTVSLLFMFAARVSGQNLPGNEEITVTAPFRPALEEVYKIPLTPEIPAETVEKPGFIYSYVEKEVLNPFSPEPIVPAKVTGESVPGYYKNLIKAGFGNYTTPYFEFFASKLRSKKSAFGVRLMHISSGAKIKDYAPAGYGNSLAEVFGKKFFASSTLAAKAGYQRNMVHFYGFRPEDFPTTNYSKSDIRQVYNKASILTSYESNYIKAGRLNHKLDLGYYYLFDSYETSEHHIHFKSVLDKEVGIFDFAESESFGADLSIDQWFFNDTLKSLNSGIVTIFPKYKLSFGEYAFTAGVNASIETGIESNMYFYPDVKAEVNVIQDALITYAGVTGYMEKNSFDITRQENPYISPLFGQEFTYTRLAQFGGIKGRIGQFVDYNLNFYNFSIDNMPLFVNDTLSGLPSGAGNQFVLVYDKARHSRVHAAVSYRFQKKFALMLDGSYNSYFMDEEDKAWHKPAVETSFSARYNLQDKITVIAELFAQSQAYARTYENNEIMAVALSGFADVNLSVEYRYTRLLSAFLNLNNLLNRQYYQWNGYPSYRFNMMAGISYSF